MSCAPSSDEDGQPLEVTAHLVRVSAGLRVLLLLGYFGTMAALYLAPLAITSPCLLEESQLPPKPDLFGHRGAPMVSGKQRRCSSQTLPLLPARAGAAWCCPRPVPPGPGTTRLFRRELGCKA